MFMKTPFFRHDVIKWRYSVKLLTYLESTFQGLSYEVLLDMVPKISKFDLGVNNFRPPALTMKVKADRHQKLISWAPDHILDSHEVWRRSDQSYSKNKGFVNLHDLPQSDLDHWPWPSKFCVLKGSCIWLWHATLQEFPLRTVFYRVT